MYRSEPLGHGAGIPVAQPQLKAVSSHQFEVTDAEKNVVPFSRDPHPLPLTVHGVRNEGHTCTSTSPAEPPRPGTRHKSAPQGWSAASHPSPRRGGATARRTPSQLTCCYPNSGLRGSGAPAPTFTASRINNRDRTRGSSSRNVPAKRPWAERRTSVREWREELCALLQKTRNPPSPPFVPCVTGEPCRWRGRRCAAPGPARSASSSSSGSSPWPSARASLRRGEREGKTCQQARPLQERERKA